MHHPTATPVTGVMMRTMAAVARNVSIVISKTVGKKFILTTVQQVSR